MLLLVTAFVIMLLIDLPRLIKKKKLKMIIVYCVIFTASFTLCMLLTLGVQIASPLFFADIFFRNVLHLSY